VGAGLNLKAKNCGSPASFRGEGAGQPGRAAGWRLTNGENLLDLRLGMWIMGWVQALHVLREGTFVFCFEIM
jgi:hypothetical protein